VTAPLLLGGAVGAYLLLALILGMWRANFIALVVALTLFPAQLTHFSKLSYTGMAPAAPELSTYALVLSLIAVHLVISARRVVLRVWWPVLIALFIGMMFVWHSDPIMLAGAAQIALAVVACGIGWQYGREIIRDPALQVFAVRVMLAAAVSQVLVCVAQLSGVPLFEMDPQTAALMGERTNGTFNHPNNLGKAMLLLSIAALPMAVSGHHRARKPGIATVGFAALAILLSGGRANVLALVMTVLIFALLARGGSPRIALPLVVLAIGGPFVGAILARFDGDPGGGSRSHFMDVALQQLSITFLPGVGPNSYVNVVGRLDPLTAGGLPVHNSFMLALVELGLVTAVLLFAPMIWWLVSAWRCRRLSGLPGAFGTAYVAAAPGIIMVAATGWGMLAGSILPLWTFVLGLLVGGMSLEDPSRTSLAAARSVPNPEVADVSTGSPWRVPPPRPHSPVVASGGGVSPANYD